MKITQVQRRRRKFIAEKDVRKATQVAKISRNQDQVKQIMFKEPKLRKLFRSQESTNGGAQDSGLRKVKR